MNMFWTRFSKVSKGERGFTLIELLVVIAIIGLLSSVVLASLNSARQRGRDTRRLADLKQLQVALELYYDVNKAYPVATNSTVAASLAGLTTGNHLPALPTDPGANTYYYSGVAQFYCLGATLETTNALPSPADSCNGTSLTVTEPTGNYRVGP